MNFTQTFDEFASSLGPTDIALYAGAAVIVWILFKDKLNPVSVFIKDIIGKVKTSANNVVPVTNSNKKEDVFFELVSSWKQTRDLAAKSGCPDAVRVADQMFPFLSPTACKDNIV
jgi:hypothetical protein